MPKRKLAAILALAFAYPGVAQAKVLVAPTILGKGLEPARDIIDDAIANKLKEGLVARHATDRFLNVKLSECKNSMSCLSRVSKPVGASHVLHSVLARRGQRVLAQFTLIEANSAEQLKRVRVQSGVSIASIEQTVLAAITAIVKSVQEQPEYKDGGTLRMKSSSPTKNGGVAVVGGGNPVAVTRPGEGGTNGQSENGTTTTGGGPQGNPFEPQQTVVAEQPVAYGPNYVAYGLWGLGAAAEITGGVFLILSARDIATRNDTPQTEVARRAELREAAIDKQTIGLISVVAGLVPLGLGTLFYVTGIGAPKIPLGQSAAVEPTANGFIVTW